MKTYVIDLDDKTAAAVDAFAARSGETPGEIVAGVLMRLGDVVAAYDQSGGFRMAADLTRHELAQQRAAWRRGRRN